MKFQLLALPKLIVACRHRCASVRGSLAFHFFASLMLSLSLLLTAMTFLPLLFDFEQVFVSSQDSSQKAVLVVNVAYMGMNDK